MDLVLEAQDILDGQEIHEGSLPLPAALDEALFNNDPDLAEFIRLSRAGAPPPLALAARLMAQGIDVEALEASIA
ncbi:MAG: hypothetical protein ACREUF_02700 [Solimonas sp.]